MLNKLTEIPETIRAYVYRVLLFATIIAVAVALIVGIEQAEIIATVTAVASLIPQVLAVVNTDTNPADNAEQLPLDLQR